MRGKLDQYATYSPEVTVVIGFVAAIVLFILAVSVYYTGIVTLMLIMVLYTAVFIGSFLLGELIIRSWKRYVEQSE